ncbi:MAG TPA: hypothetical protein VFR02_03620 [bacterium]|nr:hypothetical protein [bacterium]
MHGERFQENTVDLYCLKDGLFAALELKAARGLNAQKLARMATDLQLADLIDVAAAGGRSALVGEDIATKVILFLDTYPAATRIQSVEALRLSLANDPTRARTFMSCAALVEHLFGGRR